MSFLYPVFLAGVLAAAVPIVLHLFRRHADVQVPFSAVRFLRRAPVEITSRRKLRELVLLALRVAAIALLASAFARPFFARGAAAMTASLTLVAIDTSYSMSAPGQMPRARELARQAIAAAPSSHAVAVMSFDEDGRIIAVPDTSRSAALSRINEVRPSFGRTRYRAALRRAAETFGDRSGKLVVVTDLQQVGWDGGDSVSFGPGVEVSVADVGAPATNLAVVGLHAERGRAVAVVKNTGNAPQSGDARLDVDGRLLGSVSYTIGPATSATLTFDAALPASGIARVTIDDPVGYSADNVRVLVLDRADAPAILAVTAGGGQSDAFYLDRALQVDDEAGFRVDTMAASAVARADATSLSKYAAIFVLSSQGLDLRGSEYLAGFVKAGGGLFVAAGSQFDATLMRALFGSIQPAGASEVRQEAVSFVPANAHHPVLRPLGALIGTLADVHFRQTAPLPARDGWRVVAAFSDGKGALVEAKLGEGRILLFASDLSNRGNDFPLHPAFVPMVHETARYLGAENARRPELTPDEVPAGQPREPGVVQVVAKVAGASGASSASSASGASSARARRVAVNVDISESEMARIDAKQFAQAITRSQVSRAVAARSEARQIEQQQNLWRYGLMAMIAALIAEGLLGRRLI